MNEQRGNVDEPTQEVKALALLLEETDRITLTNALALAGPDVQTKLAYALALAKSQPGVDDAELKGM